MMKVRKAIITAAAPHQRALPLHTLVDRDGTSKSVLRIVCEEAAATGVEDICVVVCPGDSAAYAKAAGERGASLHFVEQSEPRGYGHALWCARAFAAGEPFLHLVSDHLALSRESHRCAQQLVEVATTEKCAVSAVQSTRETMLAYYGTVGGRRVPHSNALYEIEHVAEKPTPTEAEQTLLVPGLRAGHYLCFFGMHVLTPAVMELLSEDVAAAEAGARVQLSGALARLAGRERYLALQVSGQRYDIGAKYGLLQAQLALALAGRDREEILAQLVELLAHRDRPTA